MMEQEIRDNLYHFWVNNGYDEIKLTKHIALEIPVEQYLDLDGEESTEKATNLVNTWTKLTQSQPLVRTFETGANRDVEEGKLDYEGFLSPLALKRYAEYMHKNRTLRDGSIRDSDNWQKGMPKDVYMKSMFRHFFDTWSNHRGIETAEDKETNLCALLFNVMGMLHEELKEK